MKKIFLSLFISTLTIGSYAQNEVGFGPAIGVNTEAPPVQRNQPTIINQTNYLTPNNIMIPVKPNVPTNGYTTTPTVNSSNTDSYVPSDVNYKPIYKSDAVAQVKAQDTSEAVVTPVKKQGSLFEECMIRSSKMLDVLDALKKMPEKDRVSTLFKSGYWSELSEVEKDQMLQTIADMSGVDESKYLVIKGKMAGSFERECLDLAKTN